MAILGYKSLNSLAIYQKVSTDEKLAMGYSMRYYLQTDTTINNKQVQLEMTKVHLPSQLALQNQ